MRNSKHIFLIIFLISILNLKLSIFAQEALGSSFLDSQSSNLWEEWVPDDEAENESEHSIELTVTTEPEDDPDTSAAIIVDHTSTDITKIPESAITQAKNNLHIAYGHTSHGSQLISGMNGLDAFLTNSSKFDITPGLFVWNDGPKEGYLDLDDNAMSGDVGYYPQWVNNTRSYLGDPDPTTGRGTEHSDVNVIIWSWCGQVDSKYASGTLDSQYLTPMSELETDYPGITFVYMTGHVDHWDDANNKAANQIIRDFVKANNKVLYDFADIESYDPDGNYYEFPHDNCNYYSADGTLSGNWCTEWQDSHEENVDWWASGAAHSQHINGNLKGYAAWWLWARLGGWPGINTEPELNDPNADHMQTKGVKWDGNGRYQSAIDFTINKSYHVGFSNHWPLNGNTNNRIKNALDFSSENELIFSDDGPYGQYVDIQPGHIIHTAGQVIYSNSARSVGFSVSVWMRPKELKGTIWGQGYGSPCLRFNEYSPGTLRFSIVNQDTGSPYINACPELIPLDEWIHVTCIFDPFENRLKLYLNGELKTSVDTTDGCSIRSTGNFYIGNQEQKNETHAFIGGLSDMAIWNRVLSDSEVADLAKASSPIGDRIESHFVSKRVNKDNDRFSDLMLDWQEENGSADVFISFGGLDWIKVEKGVWLSELTDNIQNEIGGYAGFRYRFDFKDAVWLSNLTIQYKHEMPEFNFNGFPLGTNLGKVSYYSIGSSFVDLMIGAEFINTEGGQNQMNASDEEPRGVHTLSFEGTGTIVIRTGFGDKTFSEPGIYTVPVQEKRNISYYIRESSTTDPIRNVKFIMPGFWDTHETQPFHPRFLESLRGMKVLRFMDWARTNTLQEHSWENRPKPSDLVQGGDNGISIEYMIKLANTLHIDPWFCIPHFADENYIRGYAELVQSNLDPGLNVYVEYTNEVWNGGFRNTQNWVRDWGYARGLDLPQAVVKRSLQIIEIFNDVLGADRVIGTVAGWSGNINYNENLLQAIDNIEEINTNHTKVDAFAIAPYVGGSIINDIYYAGYENAVTTRDILDMLESTLPDYKTRLQSSKALTDQHGVKLICYEGGQHMVGTGRVVNNRLLTSKMIEANRDPRFYEIYRHYFRIWDEIVGDVFAHFTNYGNFSKYGSWSILESYFVKPGDAPKFRAVRQVADQFEIEQGGVAPIYGNGIIELTEECDNDTFLNNITSCEAYSKKFSFGNVGCSDRGRITTDNCVLAPCTLLPPTFDNNHWIETLTESQEIKLFVQGSECHGEKVTFNVYYDHESIEEKQLIDTVEASSNADGFAIAVWNVVVPPEAPKYTLRYYLEAVPEYGDSTWIEGSGWVVENESGQPNQAPLVDAGLDQTITLPNDTITLNGVVSDDGLPENPGVVVTTWSLISGPESVSFSDVNAFDSNVTFSAPGIYILNLNADDGDLQSNDELSVTVESAPLLTASRTTGVAPLGVNFTAGVPASTPESRPFHDLDYVWDFGDPSGSVWAVSGKSKNTAQGPVAAHIFETPGEYTVTLTTSDHGGPISVETVQITIQDPNLVYSGTNTICICDATSNDFTGCPSGAQQITTDDVSHIKSAVASNRRILLQRGSSWSSDGLDSSETRIGYSIVGPVTIGAYGNCANPDERGICENAPVINLNYPIPYGDPEYEYKTFFSISRASDWRIKDISFIGNYDYDIMAGGAIDIGPFLFLRLKTTGFRLAISISLSQSTGHDQLMVVDSDLSDAYINVMYAGYENMAVMGNSFRDARTSHVVRIWQAYNAVISHNCISGASLDNNNGRHALKLHGVSEDKLTDQYGTRERTHFVVLADNVFGTSGPWAVCIGPQDSLNDERLTDIIVEKNRFFADYGNLSSRLVSRPLVVWARDVSVRNNIFDGNGSDPSYAAVVIEQRGIEPAPSGIMVSNNTIYKTDVDNILGAWNFFAGVQVENTAGNIGVFNNLAVFPESTKGEAIVIIRNMDDSAVTESNNLLIQGTYSGLTIPDLPDHLKRDFSLLNDSPAIDQGISIQLFRDFTGALRPVNGVLDIGAFEYIATPKLKQAIIILKVLAGMDPGGVDLANDTDNDGILDMQDVLNILQSVSGTIQEPETLTPYAIDRGVVSRNNIFARAASHGTHQRSGGLAENNLYVQNSIGLLQ